MSSEDSEDSEDAADAADAADARAVKPRGAWRFTLRHAILAVLALAFLGGAAYLWRNGSITSEGIRAWLEALGWVAPILFIGAFVGGGFVGLPGVVFVIGGVYAFGPWGGLALGYGGGMLSTFTPFIIARTLRRDRTGGWRPKQKLLAKAFALLETHPFRAIVVLRLLVWYSPPLSYALAMTSVPTRIYVAACATSLVPVTIAVVAITAQLA
ncbi:MAG: VTT domain-containing protein [Deltaproteobacteria bacterium]|nr:VTT domain-containing protein [Deltaproteobacteria bacterium]